MGTGKHPCHGLASHPRRSKWEITAFCATWLVCTLNLCLPINSFAQQIYSAYRDENQDLKLTILIKSFEKLPLFFRQFLGSYHVHFVHHNKQGFVSKERFDAIEQLNLFLKCVSALLRNIHDVKNGCSEVCKSCDGLQTSAQKMLQ